MKLNSSDIMRLVEFYRHAVRRKFDIDIGFSLEDLYLSDMLITLFFKNYNAAKSKLAVTVVGSFFGSLLVELLGARWDLDRLLVVGIGPLKLYSNPFSASYERLARGLSRSLFERMESITFRSGQEFKPELRADLLRENLNKLDGNGWTDEMWAILNSDEEPLSLRMDYARILGRMMRYLDNVKLVYAPRIEEMLSSDLRSTDGFDRIMLGLSVLQDVAIPDLLPKILKFLTLSGEHALKLKIQAIASLRNFHDKLVQEILQEAFEKEPDLVVRSVIASSLGRFRNDEIVNFFRKKLENADDTMEIVVLLNGVQTLGDSRLADQVFELLERDDEMIREEALKTFQYLNLEAEHAKRLIPYLSHPNGHYRVLAAYGIAYSKLKDKLELLKVLSNDPLTSVQEHVSKLVKVLKYSDKPTFYCE